MLFDINWTPDRRELRKFGIGMLVAFPVFGAVMAWLHSAWQIFAVCAALGVVFAASAWLAPPLGRVLYRAWMGLAFVMGLIVAPIVLGVLYFLVFTPIGLIMRATGHNPLPRRKPDAGSFWRPVEQRTDVKSYERPF